MAWNMLHTVHKSSLGTSVVTALVVLACGSATKENAEPLPPPPPPPSQQVAPASAAPQAVAEKPKATEEAAKAPEHHAPHWTYAGDTGVTHWGDLSSEWATCKSGQAQSPIDLITKNAVLDAKLPAFEFKYGKLPLSIFNNGHTVQVPNDKDYTIKVNGQLYKLAQFHLHSPSEHLVDGKPLDFELHLVHKSDQGAITVVGVLFKKGKENKALAPVITNAPAELATEAKPVANVDVDLAQLLPQKHGYYSYTGSLTTPPCTEGVNWIVMQSFPEISEAQIAKFREVTHGDTVRPAQPLGARKVSRSK
jgi:carbonic anhydrase